MPADVVLLGGEADGLARHGRPERRAAPRARQLARDPGVRGLADHEVVAADEHDAEARLRVRVAARQRLIFLGSPR